MEREIVDAITEWETAAVASGYAGLHELADRSFSGAITADGAWAFMLNGRVVGVVDGPLSAFETAAPTAYRAPDPALPLLYTMVSGDPEKEAAYYTNRTPIAEVDETLSAGGFTGYIELSENVHSGDYYVVYYGGKSMSVAFVGNQRRLLTDGEAFDRANDEVGIYDVFAADIEVTPLPAVESTPASVAATADEEDETDEWSRGGSSVAASGGSTAEVGDDWNQSNDPATDESTPDAAADAGTAADDGPIADTGTRTRDDTGASTGSADEDIMIGIPGVDDDSDDGTTVDTAVSGVDEDAEVVDDGADGAAESDDGTDGAAESDDGETVGATEGAGTAGYVEEMGDDTAPESTEVDGKTDEAAVGEEEVDTVGAESPIEAYGESEPDASAPGDDEQPSVDDATAEGSTAERTADPDETSAEGTTTVGAATKGAAPEATAETIAALRSELEAVKREIRRLQNQQTAASTAQEPTQTLGVEEALAETNLFVRYESRGKPTLETVHGEGADPEVFNENLRIDHHTTFDADGVVVGGQPFEAFLADSIEVGFVDWLVGKLPFEIRETRNQDAMGGVYDAIPAIDRIELRGEIDVGAAADGNDEAEGSGGEVARRRFDLVVRDKMDEPLFVVDIEDAPRPVAGERIERLIREGNDLTQRVDSVTGVFAVATSYYSPEAIEAVSDATGGGLLRRGKKKGFVNVSRKRGFHLCLTNQLNGEFDLRVPEL